MGDITIGEYLLTRLHQLGARDIFGVPGDFALTFNKVVADSKILRWVGTCNELNAAYAADGYARIKGVGAVSVTYGVGELSALNGIAGAYTERVPVVIITGSPPSTSYSTQPLLHHTLGDYDIPRKIFKTVCCAAITILDSEKGPEMIDQLRLMSECALRQSLTIEYCRALTTCIREQRPVYISLPADLVNAKCPAPLPNWKPKVQPFVDAAALSEAVAEVVAMMKRSKRPIIVSDTEMIRYGLRDKLKMLVDRSRIPYTTMMMGKAILDETNPLFVGQYMGCNSREYVQNRVEDSDFTLILGAMMTDLNTGGFSFNIHHNSVVKAMHSSVQIRQAVYANVPLGAFLDELIERVEKSWDLKDLDVQRALDHAFHRPTLPWKPIPQAALTMKRFFDKMAHFIPKNAIVIGETGNALFGAAETLMPSGVTFIGQVFYASIGFSLGAALGAAIAAPQQPLVLFIGDGSFQMTAVDLSTIIRHKLNPTIFLLNNYGYTIERLILDGPFNDIANWNYTLLPKVFGGEKEGTVVETEDALHTVLQSIAFDQFNFVEVRTDKWDSVTTLQKATQIMRERVVPSRVTAA